MNIETLHKVAITPAFSLLPEKMRAQQARVMLVAICLQESNLAHRRQVAYYRGDDTPILGRARGWPQFERIGVAGVMQHRATGTYAREVADTLGYPFESYALHHAMEHNDVLALAYARLNLWTYPGALPEPGDIGEAFRQYLAVWRPGAWTRGTTKQREQLQARWGRNYAGAT